jgi:anti-sigma factor ChrR (cupin superfamily)
MMPVIRQERETFMAGKTPNYPAHDALEPTQSRFVDVESMPWIQQGPGMKMKCLYKDDEKKEGLYLFLADPGAQIPEHLHTGCELTFILEGGMEDHEGACTAGNFVWRPQGSRHTAKLPNGGKYLVFFKGSAQRVATGNLFPGYDDTKVKAVK